MTTAAHTEAPETGQRSTRHFGKYRGTVSDNKDPRNQGRIRAKVPEVLGEVETGWALPCAPYAGSKTGAFTLPAVGAGVWLEFEAGDVSRPIWVGCWWVRDQQPTDESGTGATPDVRVIRSEEGMLLAFHDDSKTIALSDSNGSNILKIEVQQGLVTLQAATKVVVEAPQIELVANATHPGVFGDTLSSYLNQIVTMFNSHVHPGQMAASLPVSPAPPQPPLPPPSPSMLSTKVKLG
jgi:uncharacterized protein involved in type VI secretion and phage assembly